MAPGMLFLMCGTTRSAAAMTARCFGVKPLVGVDLHLPTHPLVQGGTSPTVEHCDSCGRSVPTREIHFDGHLFLCEGCANPATKAERSAKASPTRTVTARWKSVALKFLGIHGGE